MSSETDGVQSNPLPRPLRYATREAWYAARVSGLYASGFSSAVCNVLSRPLPKLGRGLRRNRGVRRLPVLMLHGLAHNQSWSIRIQQELHRSGFVTKSTNYNTFSSDLDRCADIVAEHIWEFTGSSGVPAVHVVAHSIGGIVLRAALNRHLEIQDYVATGVTVGSPHNGTPWAYAPLAHLVPKVGHLVSEVRPSSPSLTKLDHETVSGPTQWVSVYSTTDEVVPAHYGRLDHPLLAAKQVELNGIGHYGLMFHENSVNAIVNELESQDHRFAAQWDSEFGIAS